MFVKSRYRAETEKAVPVFRLPEPADGTLKSTTVALRIGDSWVRALRGTRRAPAPWPQDDIGVSTIRTRPWEIDGKVTVVHYIIGCSKKHEGTEINEVFRSLQYRCALGIFVQIRWVAVFQWLTDTASSVLEFQGSLNPEKGTYLVSLV